APGGVVVGKSDGTPQTLQPSVRLRRLFVVQVKPRRQPLGVKPLCCGILRESQSVAGRGFPFLRRLAVALFYLRPDMRGNLRCRTGRGILTREVSRLLIDGQIPALAQRAVVLPVALLSGYDAKDLCDCQTVI